MPRKATRAATRAGEIKVEIKMKNATEIQAIGTLALAASEKLALEAKHQGEGKPAKELTDIEAGIVGWLLDNGWMMKIESDALRGRADFVITSQQTVNPYAQAQIAASHLRSLGFKVLVMEGTGGNVLVDVMWS